MIPCYWVVEVDTVRALDELRSLIVGRSWCGNARLVALLVNEAVVVGEGLNEHELVRVFDEQTGPIQWLSGTDPVRRACGWCLRALASDRELPDPMVGYVLASPRSPVVHQAATEDVDGINGVITSVCHRANYPARDRLVPMDFPGLTGTAILAWTWLR